MSLTDRVKSLVHDPELIVQKEGEGVMITGPDFSGVILPEDPGFRYFAGHKDNQPISRKFPSGTCRTLEEAVHVVVEVVKEKFEPPAGK